MLPDVLHFDPPPYCISGGDFTISVPQLQPGNETAENGENREKLEKVLLTADICKRSKTKIKERFFYCGRRAQAVAYTCVAGWKQRE